MERKKHIFGIAINVIKDRIYTDSRRESHKDVKRSIGCFQATQLINNLEQTVKATVNRLSEFIYIDPEQPWLSLAGPSIQSEVVVLRELCSG